MKETDTHYYFLTNFLSNFNRPLAGITVTKEEVNTCFPSIVLPVNFESFNFRTTEHVFMWVKALFFKDTLTAAQITEVAHPAEAKKLGRQVKNFDANAWDSISYNVMYFANLLRFEQNPDQLKQLKATYPKKLVECNRNDRIWAIGLDVNDKQIFDEKNWKGENRLGEVHMQLREQL